jgi:nucleoside-diphosphate-sugar epimerase
MKVLIVGSRGFIGRHLLNHLASTGIDVCGVSSSDGKGIEAHTGVLSEQFSIPPGTDTIIYLAQSPYYRQVPEMASHLLNVNVTSAVKVADMARRLNVSRFIYTSTGNVYAPSFKPLSEDASLRRDNWYSLSKIHAEETLSLFRNDLNITIVRLFGVYGPGQTDKIIPKLLNSLAQGVPIFLERNLTDPEDLGGLKLSTIFIKDILEILTKLICISGTPYLNIAGDEVVSIRQIAEMMGIILEKDVKIETVNKYRSFDLIADIELLRKTLSPNFTPFEIGIQETIRYALNEFSNLSAKKNLTILN